MHKNAHTLNLSDKGFQEITRFYFNSYFNMIYQIIVFMKFHFNEKFNITPELKLEMLPNRTLCMLMSMATKGLLKIQT